ncbi:MAG: DUF445 family protein [Spirochaetaceae bacterium]|nr:DUF445 family protein [Spirochaetaceae bacterium]
MIPELLISVLGGALVGWITNSIAVNMLFKKFLGRWGGVIESNYKELIQNLSRLVEQKLINTQTLQKEIEKEAFNDILHTWVKDILQNELPEKTKNLYVKDIPGIDTTIKHFTDYIKHERLPLDGITLKQILSEASLQHFADRNISKLCSDNAEYKNIADETLNNFFANRTFDDFFSETLINQIKININKIIGEIDFSQYGAVFDQVFEQLVNSSCIDAAIEKLENYMGGMSISELAETSRIHPYETLRALLDYIAGFTESARGKELLRNLINELINEAGKLDITVSSILHPRLIENIGLFIESNTPGLIDRLILFVNESRYEIDKLIDEAAKQHFNKNGTVNNPVQAFVFNALTSNSGFTNKIIEVLAQNRDKAGKKLYLEFNEYLNKTFVSAIISQFRIDNAEILDAENIVNAINKKLRNIRFEDFEALTVLMNVKIKNMIPNLDLSFIKIKLIPYIFNKLKQFFCGNTVNQKLQEKINSVIDSFIRRNIGSVINIKNVLCDISETGVKDIIFRQWENAANTDIGSIAADKAGKIQFTNIKEDIKNYKINDIYNALQTENLYGKTANAIQTLITDNLDTILGGNVFDIAKNELSVLSPSQVNKVVQDFMGTQLKPINIIGAILGGIAGAVTVFITYILKTPESFTWTLFAVYGLIFSVVGIATNWIAIKMLFHPYKKIFGLNFPPFIGIAAYKKAEFASGIAKLIQRNMLNKAALRRFYAEKKDGLLLQCKERLSAENYKFVGDFFADDARRTAVIDSIFNFLRVYIKKSGGELAEGIDNYITKQLESGRLENLAKFIQDALIKKMTDNNFSEYIGKKIQDGAAGKTLSGIPWITGAIIDICCQYLQNVFNIEKITALLRPYEAAFDSYIESYIKNHSLNDFAGKETMDALVKLLSEKAAYLPKKAGGGIAGILAKKQFHRLQSLRNCCGEIIPELINSSRVIGIICGLASNQKQVIVDKIMDGAGGASFFGQIVKQAANALMRKDIEAITEIVIDEKLFPFLNTRRGAILGIVNNLLEKPLNFDCEIFNKDKIGPVLSRLFAGGIFLGAARNISAEFLNYAASTKLKKMLLMINAATGIKLLERLLPLLKPLLFEINVYLNGGDPTASSFKKAVTPMFLAIFKDIPAASILQGVDTGSEIYKMLVQFFNDKAALKNTRQILDNALQKILSDKDFYDHVIFRKDLSEFMINCVGSADVMRRRFAPFFNGLFCNINTLIDPAAKNAVCGDYLLPALFNACGNQFPNLANTLSLYAVVEQEINMMSPKEIKEMFYSFSGSYFEKIILYGWIGLFGGLLSYVLGCLAARLFL